MSSSRLLTLGAILCLAGTVRVYKLGGQLWLDEIDALTDSVRRPVAAILTEWPPGSFGLAACPHLLNDLLAHGTLAVFGESPFALRLPAALFGILGVAALFLLVERRLGRGPAVLASLLLAVSHPHVFQSQNARGYTALLFFATVASDLLLCFRGDNTRGLRAVVGYAVAAALAAYALPLGAFVLAGHAAAVLGDTAVARVRGRSCGWPLGRVMAAMAGAGVLIGVAYLPFLTGILEFAAGQSRLPRGTGPGLGPIYRLGVVHEALRGLIQAFGGPFGFALAVCAAALGFWIWRRRDAASLVVFVLPVALQIVALTALDVPQSPRYFAAALLPLVVALAVGLDATGTAAASRLSSSTGRLSARVLPAVLAVIFCAWPLAGYYAVPKQDFEGAMARVDARAQPGDRRVAVQHAGRILRGYYRAPYEDVRSVEQLVSLEDEGRRILVVATLERFLAVQNPALYERLQSSYRRLESLPAGVAGAEMVLYERGAQSR
jgi:mannosyltransferase